MAHDASKPRWQEIQDEFYSDPKKHSHLGYEPESTYARDLTDHLAKALRVLGTQTVLEIGAGAGRFSLHLAPHCRKLIATDTSQPLLDALENERYDHSNVETQCINAFDLAAVFGPGSLDAICGFFILHHLPDHEVLFRLLFTCLRSGGCIGFLEPNRINPLFLAQVIFSPEMKWEAEKGMFTFSAHRTVQLLQSIGFQDIAIKRMGFFPPPVLDRAPSLLNVQRKLENVPGLRRFLPFVILTATKP